jgi:fido (protein-threonine AMPylation protein)
LWRPQVRVGVHYGTDAAEVAEKLAEFERKLNALLRGMDAMLPTGQELDADRLAAVVDLCAWVHAEWVRIHPFANGNGCTARLWANFIAMLYGLPPFIRFAATPEFRLWRSRRQGHAGRLEADRRRLPAIAGCFPG